MIKIKEKIKKEYKNMLEILDGEQMDLNEVSSIFNPKYLEDGIYFPYLLKSELKVDEIKAVAKSVVSYVLYKYNEKLIEYLKEEYSITLDSKFIIDNLDEEIDEREYKNDKVFSWAVETGFDKLNKCLNQICVDTDDKLIDLIKITDLQLGFSTGDSKDDLIRWIYEIPLSYEKRLENKNLLKKDKLSVVKYLEEQLTYKRYKSKLLYTQINGDINHRGEDITFELVGKTLQLDIREENYNGKRTPRSPYSISRSHY
ncbi:MAG: hypothetical protein ACOCRX_06475 [Candidatus Woesearchaeota archaeon]